MAGHIFISHSTYDDDLVISLRRVLEELGYSAWADSRELTAGEKLEAEDFDAVREASHLLAVLSPHAFNSAWMRKEIALGLEMERERDGFKVVPLLIPPMEPESLTSFFKDQPLALTFDPENDRFDDLRANLRAAFGGAKPDDAETIEQPAAAPLAELVAEFEDLSIEEEDDGERRAVAKVKLRWSATGYKTMESKRFTARSPLGPIEVGELAWYLERYASWPGEVFRPRAKAVEDALVKWGRLLFETLQRESTSYRASSR
ncbi:MAG: toll/interleukin-1 receptor domain-containing protein, partial [Planctomycetota bacterium]